MIQDKAQSAMNGVPLTRAVMQYWGIWRAPSGRDNKRPSRPMQLQKAYYDFRGHSPLTIGIVSDTHGELNHEIANTISRCDIALHAGDIMHVKPLNELKSKLGKVFAVKGNNDVTGIWPKAHAAILSSIPDQVTIDLPSGKLVMEHAHRVWHHDTSVMHHSLRTDHADAKLVVYGHTHIRSVDQMSTLWILNPGAAGRTRVYDGPSCITLRINQDEWTIEEHLFSLESNRESHKGKLYA